MPSGDCVGGMICVEARRVVLHQWVYYGRESRLAAPAWLVTAQQQLVREERESEVHIIRIYPVGLRDP